MTRWRIPLKFLYCVKIVFLRIIVENMVKSTCNFFSKAVVENLSFQISNEASADSQAKPSFAQWGFSWWKEPKWSSLEAQISGEVSIKQQTPSPKLGAVGPTKSSNANNKHVGPKKLSLKPNGLYLHVFWIVVYGTNGLETWVGVIGPWKQRSEVGYKLRWNEKE